jgi:hypothetical protein
MLRGVLRGIAPNLQHKDLTKHLLLVEYADELSYHSETKAGFFDLLSAAYFGVLTTLAFYVAIGESRPDPASVVAKLSRSIKRLAELGGKELEGLAPQAENALHAAFSKASFEASMRMKLW